MNPVTVGLYARSSARDQIAGQLQDLHAFATDHGWGTFEYIDQGMSGVTSQRPALDAMLAARGPGGSRSSLSRAWTGSRAHASKWRLSSKN